MNEPNQDKTDTAHDPISGDATDEHPAGRIKLPSRLRAEYKILGLVGAAYIAEKLGTYGDGDDCRMMASITANGGSL